MKQNPITIIEQLQTWAQSPNIANVLSQNELDELGSTVTQEYKLDLESRKNWETSAKKAMETVEAVPEAKSYPFEKAANIKYPLLTTATLQFAARAYPAIVQGPTIVNVAVKGKDPHGQKAARAKRVAGFMSYQLLEQMPEWQEDTDALLHQMPVVGCAFRKTYWSSEKDRTCSEMVSAFDFVVNNNTKNLEDCPRATHIIPPLYPHEIEERTRTGTFLKVDLEEPEDGGEDSQAPHDFLEQHRRIDLDKDGYAEPYIVTVHKQSNKVVRIVANYKLSDIRADGTKIIRIPARSYFTKYSFIPDPNGGYYDIGYGKLLESMTATVNSTLNQMLDAGHLQNAGGGFIGSGLTMKKSTFIQEPGKYHSVQATGSNIREAIVHIEHPGPSNVLFQLMGMIIEAGKEVASISDVMTGDVQRNQTATTTLALIEQGLKVFTAIYKRIFRSLSREFKILYQLNGEYLSEEEYQNYIDENIEPEAPEMMGHNQPEGMGQLPMEMNGAPQGMPQQQPLQGMNPQEPISKEADFNYGDLNICPIANPNEVTDMQKMGRAQLLLETSKEPGINREEALRRFLEAASFEDIDKLILPAPQGPSPAEKAQEAHMEAMIKKILSEITKNEALAEKAEAEAIDTKVEATLKAGEAMSAEQQGANYNEHYAGAI